MYVVVVYDSDPVERANIRAVLMPSLHWIQNSVFAGELTRVAAEDLFDRLKAAAEHARIKFWMFDRPPEARELGTQDDRESIFL